MESYDDHRTKKLKDKITGRWFEGRTTTKVYIETLGRSIALTMRIILRKDIGLESFSFWMVFWGLFYIRFCIFLHFFSSDTINMVDAFFSPYAFYDAGSSFLNLYSFLFIGVVISVITNTEFQQKNNDVIDVLGRGESVPLLPLIDDDNSFFRKKGVVQSFIASSVLFLLGLVFIQFDNLYGIGVFFILGSLALLKDETNYHRARVRLDRIMDAKILQAKKKQEKKSKKNY